MTSLLSSGYWDLPTKQKAKVRRIVLQFYIHEAQGDMKECFHLINESLQRYEEAEQYEHCAVLNDILIKFGH